MNDTYLLNAISVAYYAGLEILDVYHSDKDFSIEYKADESPLTLADKRSHLKIVSVLSNFNLPILSEEGRDIPYEERKKWEEFWLIDPLDGTKEFIKKNDEFTVNIALIKEGRPILGVIYLPVKDILYFASEKTGSYRLKAVKKIESIFGSILEKGSTAILSEIIQLSEKLPIPPQENRPFTVVGSRSHGTEELNRFIENLKKEKGEIDFISSGSSLKICRVAEGSADIYPRLGPTMEWDTAAGQAIAEIAHADLLHYDSRLPLTYNKENLLNPFFIVQR